MAIVGDVFWAVGLAIGVAVVLVTDGVSGLAADDMAVSVVVDVVGFILDDAVGLTAIGAAGLAAGDVVEAGFLRA